MPNPKDRGITVRSLFLLLFLIVSLSGWAHSQTSILSVSPSVNALNIAPNSSLAVTFSARVDTSTINNITVCINGSISGLHAGTFSFDGSGTIVTVTPASPFKAGETVTAAITRGVMGEGHDSLARSFVWSFVVRAAAATGAFESSSVVKVGTQPWYLTAAELDTDDAVDLAVANNYSDNVSILKNSGNGVFENASTIKVGYYPASITSADLDGDGDVDLASTNSQSSSVSILRNNGQGVFRADSAFVLSGTLWSIGAADLDGDGDIDLAVTNYAGMLFILENNGSGFFTLTSALALGSTAYSVTAADLNNDGANDLVVTKYGANSIAILINNGRGVFTVTRTVAVGAGPMAVAAVDMDGDQDVDLAVVNFYGNSISIVKNGGQGTFTASSSIRTGNYPTSVVALDAEGNGTMDLAVVNADDGTVSIMKNDGTGSFASSSTVSVGKTYSPRIMTAADLNGDEKIDLAVVNLMDNSVSILLNGATPVESPVRVSTLATLAGPIYAGLSILGDDVMYAIATGYAVYRMNIAGDIAYTLQVGGDIRSSSAISSDTTVYIASSDRNLYAFSKDGNSLWPPLPTGGALTATPVVDSAANRLYIGVSNHNFIAVNRTTGLVSWNYFADDQIKQSAVVTADRKLVFVSAKGTLYGFDLNALSSPAVPAWQLSLPGGAPGPLAVDGEGFIYVGTDRDSLYKVSLPANGQASVVWSTFLGGAILTSPVIDGNGIVYVGALNSKLYAVEPQTGAIKWAFDTHSPIRSTPAISDIGNIYVANDGGLVYALDADKHVLWQYQGHSPIAAPLLHYKNNLYVGTLDRQIIKLAGKEDSLETTGSTKAIRSAQSDARPMWSTFQGNSMRTGMASSMKVTGMKNGGQAAPDKFTLQQNYPNPFNPATTIGYQIPATRFVSLKVFDLLGREVATLVDEVKQAGNYSVQWDASAMPSGMYVCVIHAGGYREAKRMMLMK